MGTFYSGAAGNDVQSSNVDINDTRRMFNFGDRVAELAPQQSPFFVYLSKVAKKATDDPVFKFLEQRHQWQRRNFTVHTTVTSAAYTAGTAVDNVMKFECGYDEYGNIAANSQPKFLLEGQVVAIKADDGNVYNWKIDGAPDLDSVAGEAEVKMIPLTTHTQAYTAGNAGQVVGSAFAEGTGAPLGWEDKMFDREGYTQIFKTAMNMFSGTAMATSYRGIKNEYQRVWQEKLMEHKMDI